MTQGDRPPTDRGDGAGAAMLSLVDIRKSYATGPVVSEILRGVRLDVNRGDLLSIVGPSGCGKSTLMNIIGLLDRPSAGAFRIKGQETGAMNDRELSALRNRSIGFVFQAYHLLPRLRAWENVALPLVYRGMAGASARRRACETLDRVGMAERTDHRPGELSGGQCQRVAIARALAGEPDVLLADEPTGALDPETAGEIMGLIAELNESERLTAVIITHDRDLARQCARRVRMHDGTLNEAPGQDRHRDAGQPDSRAGG